MWLMVSVRSQSSFEVSTCRSYDEYDLADRVRMNGWVIPAYTMPADAE